MLYHGQFKANVATVTAVDIAECLSRCVADTDCVAAAYSARIFSCRIVTSQTILSYRTFNSNYEMYAKDANCGGKY